MVRRRKRGAEPSRARPTRMREPEYRQAFAAERTTKRRTALMRDGRMGMEARLAAMTKGEAVASVAEESKESLV